MPQETKIRWPFKPLYTLNPVIGCKRNCSIDGRPWCYAAKISNRFRMVPDFTKPVFFPERLKQKFKPGSHVFVGSMSDPEYWHYTWMCKIIDYCLMNPMVSFYFLSKNPSSYSGYGFPKNCCIGLTMTLTQTSHCQHENIDEMLKYQRSFLSLEPLLGKLEHHDGLHLFEKIIIGEMTGPGAVNPKQKWVDSIKRLKLDNVFWKQDYLKGAKYE